MRVSSDKVNIDTLIPSMWQYLIDLDNAHREFAGYELIITSGEDGKHSVNTSDHYRGGAVDMRTWTTHDSGVQMQGAERTERFEQVKASLGKNWYVKNEVDHFHLSYRPRYSGD